MTYSLRIALLGALCGAGLACGDDGPAADGSTGSSGTTSDTTTSADGSSSGSVDTSDGGGSSSGGGETTSSTSGEDADSTGTTTGEPMFPDPRGYTLFAPMASRFTYLIDADGWQVHSWESDRLPANAAYLLPNGHLLRVGRDPDATAELISGAGGIVQEYDWDGNLVWQFDHVGEGIVGHHDIERMPNGHILIIAYEEFSVAEAIQAGREPDDVHPDGLWADFVVEVDPATNEIVWEWHVWDHLVQENDPMVDNYGVLVDHPELINISYRRPTDNARLFWTHTNAITYNAQLDQIMLSPRTFSELWVIDHSTTAEEAAGHTGGASGRGGDLLYRWGNPATYDAGDADDRQLFYQHTPRWIPLDKPGASNILVFDNGDDDLRPWSRVVEFAPPVQPDGSYTLMGAAYGPDAPEWSYEDQDNFYAPNTSGVDRLSDGRTLVCSGPTGELFEVGVGSSEVGWTYTIGFSTFRAERYEADYPAWDTLEPADLEPRGAVVIDFS